MTSTIVRVKRRLEEDPVEALLLSFKRKKCEDAPSEQALLRLATTVEEKSDLATTKSILKTKKDLREPYKSHLPDIVNKKRQEAENTQKQNRFKILSLNRFEESANEASSSEDNNPISIVDVGSESEDSDSPTYPTHAPKYVYDLYSSEQFNGSDIDDGCLEMLQSVQPFSFPMEYRGSEDTDEIDQCEEDSNDEGDYRNDYPDSDNSSIDEDRMRLAASFGGVGIDDGDLSSDSEDELIISLDTGYSPNSSYRSYEKQTRGTLRTMMHKELENYRNDLQCGSSLALPEYSSSDESFEY